MKNKKKCIGVILLVCIMINVSSCSLPSAKETQQQLTQESGSDLQISTKDQIDSEESEGTNESSESSESNESNESNESSESDEQPGIVRIDGRSLRNLVADILAKSDKEAIYEKDLEGWVGSMESYQLSIKSGNDMEFARKYFDSLGVTDITVSDYGNWNESQYKMLADFTGLKKLKIGAGDKIFPLEELKKLPKLEELTVVVTGIQVLPQFSLPDHVKTLELYMGDEGEYGELLGSLRESSITKLRVFMDTNAEFLLDDIADCSSLEALEIDEGFLRIENTKKTGQLKKLKEISFSADQNTDFSLVAELPAIENIKAAITETVDIAPLFDKKNLGLYLILAQEKAEFSEERYPQGKVVDVNLEAYTSLDEAKMEPSEYPAAYQQFFDKGKRIESFVLRTGTKDGEIHNTEPVIIVSGEKIYQELVQDRTGRDFGYGEYRTDVVRLEDINFDKKKDIIRDAGRYGNQGAAVFDAWCWDDKMQEYVYNQSFRSIMNPTIDYSNNCVRSSWRNWAASHGWAIYNNVDGELIMTAEMTESLVSTQDVPDGTEFWEIIEKKLIDGKWQQTEYITYTIVPGEKTVYPEEYYRVAKEYWDYR